MSLDTTSVLRTNGDQNPMENLVKKTLPFFLTGVFLLTIAGSFSHYLNHQNFVIGDWLINYQGGFVRRGLLGALVLWLADLSPLNPGIIVFLLQSLFYGLYFFFCFLLLRKKKNILLFSFAIFSPFIFTFQINDLGGGYRKEVIYFAFFSCLVWLSCHQSKHFKTGFIFILCMYPLLILSHEMMAVFLPYLVALYVYKLARLNKSDFLLLFLLLLPSTLAFLFALFHSAIPEDAAGKIFQSLKTRDYILSCGAIAWLDKDIDYALGSVLYEFKNRQYLYYALPLLLGCLAFLPLTNHLAELAKNKLLLVLVAITLAGTVCLMLVSKDWGRILYIHFVSLFLMSLAVNPEQVTGQRQALSKTRMGLLVICCLVYSASWHIVHVGNPTHAFILHSYRSANIFALPTLYSNLNRGMKSVGTGDGCPSQRFR